jgi:hypothetical protein
MFQKFNFRLDVVMHICNPRYLGIKILGPPKRGKKLETLLEK